VSVTDTLPAGVTVVSASASQGSATAAGGTVHVNLGSIAKNGTATVTIVVTVNSNLYRTLTNTATVTGHEIDSDMTNNYASVVTQVYIPVTPGPSKRRFIS
jgi:hypothetical protein